MDLESRGLLDTTLVVWLTDFGRTPKINSASGRDHWASAGFVVMAGAGIPGGSVLGKTDDEGGRGRRQRVLHRGRGGDDLHQARHPARPDHPPPDDRPIRLNDGKVDPRVGVTAASNPRGTRARGGASWGSDWTVGFRVWVERAGRAILGKGRLELLEAIDRWHSISAAARQIGMSYRRAWLLVQSVNEAAGEAAGRGG